MRQLRPFSRRGEDSGTLGTQPRTGTAAQRIAPGLTLALAIAAAATALSHLSTYVAAPALALIGGVLTTLRYPDVPRRLHRGITFSTRVLLPGSVVILGTGLSFAEVANAGVSSLPVLVGTLTVALGGAWFFGRMLSVRRDVRTLIGVGTGICGASAIAATDAAIDADRSDVGYALATIFTFNVTAVIAFPILGHALRLSPHAFGLFAGTAVNDMSSVVASATIFSHASVGYAVIVKMTRTLMIVPVVAGISFLRERAAHTHVGERQRSKEVLRILRGIPNFIPLFLIAVAVSSLGLIPHSWHQFLSGLAGFMITTALAAIGLSTRIRELAAAGSRPLLLGGILWLLVSVMSLLLQFTTGGITHL